MARHTTTVEFDDELWELIEAEAAHAGITVPHFIRDAVIARLVVGPEDPRVFGLFAAAVREAMQEEPEASTRRQAERSLGVLARLSAVRRRSEAQAVRAESAQIIRRPHDRSERDGGSPAEPDAPAAGRSVFRISADWSEIRAQESDHTSLDRAAPEPGWLQDESIHPDDRDSVRAGIARAARSQDICELQYRVQLGERVRLVNLRAMPLVKPDGAITEWLAIATDITDSPA